LEERILQRAHQSIRSLADLTPKTARVRRGESEVETPVELVGLDEIVIVRPAGRIPVDGVVIAGQSAVDQSPITGESIPVEKDEGDKVFAGSVNGNGALEIRSTRLARDSTLARAAQLVAEAQASKSPTQKAGERFMRWFVPFVLLADALLIILPPLFGVPFAVSFRRAMTLLVAASPCALALATPSAILAGVARAAQRGVLLKGGVHLENLGRLKALAFDKTGTITRGRPEVTDLFTVNACGAFLNELLGQEQGEIVLRNLLYHWEDVIDFLSDLNVPDRLPFMPHRLDCSEGEEIFAHLRADGHSAGLPGLLEGYPVYQVPVLLRLVDPQENRS